MTLITSTLNLENPCFLRAFDSIVARFVEMDEWSTLGLILLGGVSFKWHIKYFELDMSMNLSAEGRPLGPACSVWK